MSTNPPDSGVPEDPPVPEDPQGPEVPPVHEQPQPPQYAPYVQPPQAEFTQPPQAPILPPPPRVPRKGGSIWAGVGVGCGGYILMVILMFAVASTGLPSGMGSVVFIFLIPAIIGMFMMFNPNVRRVGLGILIIAASAWLILIGPCMALLSQI